MDLSGLVMRRRNDFIKENNGKTFKLWRESLYNNTENCFLVFKEDRVQTINFSDGHKYLIKEYLTKQAIYLADFEDIKKCGYITSYYVIYDEDTYVHIEIV